MFRYDKSFVFIYFDIFYNLERYGQLIYYNVKVEYMVIDNINQGENEIRLVNM